MAICRVLRIWLPCWATIGVVFNTVPIVVTHARTLWWQLMLSMGLGGVGVGLEGKERREKGKSRMGCSVVGCVVEWTSRLGRV